MLDPPALPSPVYPIPNLGPVTPVDQGNQNRLVRTSLLVASDWTQTVDSPLDEVNKTAWADYRQRLRDLPDGEGGMSDPLWPPPPGAVEPS